MYGYVRKLYVELACKKLLFDERVKISLSPMRERVCKQTHGGNARKDFVLLYHGKV